MNDGAFPMYQLKQQPYLANDTDTNISPNFTLRYKNKYSAAGEISALSLISWLLDTAM